ncbi:DnaJ-class molecular chaperone CbpA [Advenella kashmirensis WT001]|uniref:DnaJ-class molecular chaperone CbpA n=1 Tax=Advenella kashmirensis (strain DSM 17095 / LMG 22695 / WT001) TaxID=1036672 RepID=I3UGS9_ADVKW|nr:DnaJ-class molecular chaperone CbpA [Advenella kashmirensis WT001]
MQMKYVDYYKTLGVERNATEAQIKKAYRNLAHKYHPDVSKEPDAETKFKEVAEAYATLKDPEKRAAYDNLGQHRQGDDFVPPHQWQEHFHESPDAFSDVDLSDLLKAFAEAQREGRPATPIVHVMGKPLSSPCRLRWNKSITAPRQRSRWLSPIMTARVCCTVCPRLFAFASPRGRPMASACAWLARAGRA